MSWRNTIQKGGGGWRDTISTEEPKESVAETAIMQGLQGATGGFLDEAAGAVEAGGRALGVKGAGGSFSDLGLSEEGPTLDWETLRDAYREARDKRRGVLKKQADDNPVTAGVSQLAGAIASPMNKLAKGMSLAKGGAAIGGLQGLGASESEDLPGMAVDTATGAAIGGALGYGAGKVSDAIDSGVTRLAETVSPPRLKANADEIRVAADRLGIKVTPGMLDDTGFVERLESSLSKSPSLWGQSVKRAQDKVSDGLRSVAEGATDDASNMSAYQIGEKFKGGLSGRIAERLDPIKTVFDDVAESTKSIGIGDKSKAAIRRNVENLDAFRLTGGAGKPGQYAEMISKLQNANDVKTAMTFLNKDIEAAQGAEKQVLIAIKDKLSTLEKNAITRGAIQAARENRMSAKTGEAIGKEIVGDLKTARQGYRQLGDDLRSVSESARLNMRGGPTAFMDSLEAIPSERIGDKFFNVSNARQVKAISEKFPEEMALLRQGKLAEIRAAAVDNSMNGQGRVSAQRFLNEFRDLEPEAQQVLFGDNLSKIGDMQTVQQSLPRNFNPSGTASEQGWQDAIYQNVKDIPSYALYRAASSNIGRDLSANLLKSPQMRQVFETNPKLFQGVLSQLEQRAIGTGMIGAPQSLPRAAEDQSAKLDKDSLIQKAQGTKYQQVLQNAAQNGDQSFAAAHMVLSQRDPEYRKAMEGRNGP